MGIVENDTKVAKREKNFNIPTTTLTTVSKNKDKMIYFFLLSEYTRNTIQQATILIKEHF